MLNIPRPMAASRTARPDGVATHSFPMNGLVAQGRMAYESTPLLTANPIRCFRSCWRRRQRHGDQWTAGMHES
jgi:hypothetical protein